MPVSAVGSVLVGMLGSVLGNISIVFFGACSPAACECAISIDFLGACSPAACECAIECNREHRGEHAWENLVGEELGSNLGVSKGVY